jgi:hypothetical protein
MKLSMEELAGFGEFVVGIEMPGSCKEVFEQLLSALVHFVM